MQIPRLAFRWLILVVALTALALLALALRPVPINAPAPTPPTAVGRGATALPTRSPTSAPSPSGAPTPIPAPQLEVSAATGPLTITFGLRGHVPAGASEALLWYDTATGHDIRHMRLGDAKAISADVTITPTQEGLTLTEPLDGPLAYWWAVRDQRGAITRSSGGLTLPPPLAKLAQTAPITAPTKIAWVERATAHFRLLAAPDTAAERDLDRLADVAEASYAQAATVITTTQPVSIPVYLVPRVFWQGGVAFGQNGPVVISYLDRNYAGVENWTYFVHEVTHALSGYALPRGAEVGGLLGEGVAVYATGGHYSLEPIDAWAAVLAASDRYIPLCRLRYDFYKAQHEVAYEEGASFVGYLIRTYGLDAFRQIYAAQQSQRGDQKIGIQAFCSTDNRRVVRPTGKTAGALEQNWLAYLKTLHPTDEQRQAWELTIRFFDTMRRYQETADRPARNLPPPPNTWDRATAANFLHTATGRRATVLETMLGAVEPAIHRGDLDQADTLLDAIEISLGAFSVPTGALARDYDALAGLVEEQARALRIGDSAALDRTLATPSLTTTMPFTTGELLHDLRYTPVQIDARGDAAAGIVEVDGASLAGQKIDRALYQVRFARTARGWRMTDWGKQTPVIEPPPGPSVIGRLR